MDDLPQRTPAATPDLERETRKLGFDMASGARTGALLSVLAASKPGGALLELGTGTGLATAWLLEGMDAESTLLSVDTDADIQGVAARHLEDPRLELVCRDAGEVIGELAEGSFDLIFADAWPGKFDLLEETLRLLRPGGLYVIDDLLPQPNWPQGHAPKVPQLMERLEAVTGVRSVRIPWCTGLMLAVREG